MQKTETKRQPPILLIIILFAAILAAAVWYFTGSGPDKVPTESSPAATQEPAVTEATAATETPSVTQTSTAEAQPTRAAEAENPQQVATDAFELTYSGPMADKITTKVIEETEANDMAFSVTIAGKEYLLFTLVLNSSDGDLVTVLTDASGNKVPVAFTIEPIPTKLSAEDQRSYADAQEAVNEIVSSLILK